MVPRPGNRQVSALTSPLSDRRQPRPAVRAMEASLRRPTEGGTPTSGRPCWRHGVMYGRSPNGARRAVARQGGGKRQGSERRQVGGAASPHPTKRGVRREATDRTPVRPRPAGMAARRGGDGSTAT